MPSPCTGNTGTPGTKYTYAELMGLWIKAGGSKGTAAVAAAIALAESGGCSGDENPTDNGGTQTSWGLWQISDGTHNQPVPNIMSPGVNAQQAVAKYNASGWSPWGTYTSGAYRAFLNSGTTPNMSVPGATGTTQQAQTTAKIEPYSTDTCLVGFPGVQVPFLGNVGQFCLLPKHTGRAFIGVGLMLAGYVIMMPGLALVAVDVGLRAAGALAGPAQGAGRVVSLVNPEAGAVLTGAGSALRSGRQPPKKTPASGSGAASGATSGGTVSP